MTSQHRIVGLAAVACVAVVAGGVSFVSRALTLRSAESASMMAVLKVQSREIERLSEKLDAIDCSRRSPTLVATATAPELSPEQLEHLSAAVAAKVSQANAPAPPPQPTPENVAAFEAGQHLIATAVKTGHWTEANAREFHSLSTQVTGEERHELQARISVEINNGNIHPDFRGNWF